jgi:hypothetical protein
VKKTLNLGQQCEKVDKVLHRLKTLFRIRIRADFVLLDPFPDKRWDCGTGSKSNGTGKND